MNAITVEPERPGSACLEDVDEPDVSGESILIQAIAAAVCGTDVRIVEGKRGRPPVGGCALCWGMSPWAAPADPAAATRLVGGIQTQPRVAGAMNPE